MFKWVIVAVFVVDAAAAGSGGGGSGIGIVWPYYSDRFFTIVLHKPHIKRDLSLSILLSDDFLSTSQFFRSTIFI